MMNRDVVVELRDVTWTYPRMGNHFLNLKNYVTRTRHFNRLLKADNQTSLSSVSIDFARGDCVGIIGRNGAGKSTLLRVIAGILKPQSGSIIVSGHVTPIMELGSVLNGQLTCKENVILALHAFGWSKRQVNNKLKEVFAWSELENYLDEPLSALSSGMASRLYFSIATTQKPDVVLIDEVLSVGDQKFREKAYERIAEFIKGGSVALIVSHDLSVIEKMTNKCVWLENGKVIMYGVTMSVLESYWKSTIQ